PRLEARRRRHRPPDHARACKSIQIGRPRRLEGRLAPKLGKRKIGPAVGDDDGVFHDASLHAIRKVGPDQGWRPMARRPMVTQAMPNIVTNMPTGTMIFPANRKAAMKATTPAIRPPSVLRKLR